VPNQYQCPVGHYCPKGSSGPVPCATGKINFPKFWCVFTVFDLLLVQSIKMCLPPQERTNLPPDSVPASTADQDFIARTSCQAARHCVLHIRIALKVDCHVLDGAFLFNCREVFVTHYLQYVVCIRSYFEKTLSRSLQLIYTSIVFGAFLLRDLIQYN